MANEKSVLEGQAVVAAAASRRPHGAIEPGPVSPGDGEVYAERFDDIPISIWQEDWSAVRPMLAALARREIDDLERYLLNNRGLVEKLAWEVRLRAFNAATLQLYRAPSEEALLQLSGGEFGTDDQFTAYCATLAALARGEHLVIVEAWHKAYDGTRIYVRDTVFVPDKFRGSWGRVLHTAQDITSSHKMSSSLAYQAAHDDLTGLVNRREFERRLGHALDDAKRTGSVHALCYLDLDQFKIVNDVAGHRAGDELLKHLSNLLVTKIRASDTLGRLGGDEFGLLLRHCSLDAAVKASEALVRAIREFRFVWQGRTFECGASTGLVPIEADIQDTEQLLTYGDVACYTAKDLGRNRVHVYRREDRELARRQSEILRAADLTDVIANDRLSLYCQPIVALDATSGPPADFELLLRWREEHGDIALPEDFIPAAERYGLIAEVDRWVIRTVFRRFGRGFGLFPESGIAINLSGDSLNADDLLEFVHEQMDHSGIDPERVCFEITETAAVLSFDRARRFIEQMKGRGVRFALDDFGSGLSSFTYLKNLPVDFVKIDGSFVRDMLDNPVDRSVVVAINEIAHVKGVKTIAECADSAAIVRELRKIGVDYAQGYALDFPRPFEDFQ